MKPTDSQDALSSQERRAALSLSAIYATRMLGLFMLLPVLVLYAEELPGSTPLLIGLAIGIYGLTQALLQIPFGIASDRLGRKRVIVFGLLLFAAGSVVAAMAETITGIILGRALQGSGAVAAAVMALAADLTREDQRARAMAFIGASIGMAFSAAMVLGPLLDRLIGVAGIFWFTAVLALAAIAVVLFWTPTPPTERRHADAAPVPGRFGLVLRHPELLRLDAGIFILHMVLTASFVAIPLLLRDHGGLATAHHAWVYLGVMLAAMATMVPFVVIGEKRRRLKPVLLGAIVLLAAGELLLGLTPASLPVIILLLWLFFAAFNVLEAIMPSLVAKISPPQAKGTAMGVYTSAQFFGAFIGGAGGGWLYGQYGVSGVFLFCALMLLLWLAIAAPMARPRHLSPYPVSLDGLDGDGIHWLQERIEGHAGVAEVVLDLDEQTLWLRVDRQQADTDAIQRLAQQAREQSK